MKIRTYECMLGLCDQYFQVHPDPLEPLPVLKGHVNAYFEKDGFGSVVLGMNAWLAQRAQFIFRPIFWLPVSCFVFLIHWRRYNTFDRLLVGGASIYMLSFFLLNQAASFRYMFPVYAIYTAYQIRFIGWLFCFLKNKLMSRYAQPKNASGGAYHG